MTAQPSLLKDRAFLILFSARAISVLGNGFARIALAFAVLGLPGATPTDLSIVLACMVLPQVLFILVGGVIADRTSRSGLMVFADVLGFVSYAGLAVLLLTGQATVPVMAGLGVIAGLAVALFAPAMSGVVPEVVPAERLQQANSMLRVAMSTSLMLGLGLSGVAVSLVGPGWALALNAVSFVVSGLLVRRLRLPAQVRTTVTSGWADLRDGWREFSSRQWLWVVVLQLTATVASISAVTGVLGPIASEDGLGGAPVWAVIIASQSLGTVAGAWLAARIRPRRPLLVAVLGSFVYPLPMVMLGLAAPVWLTIASMFACGITFSVFGVLWATTMQREIPQESLSRVSSYDWLGQLTLAPLSLLFAGPLASEFGYGTVLLCCAALTTAAALGALLSPQVRNLRG